MSDYAYLVKQYKAVLPAGWNVAELHGEADIAAALTQAELEAKQLYLFYQRWCNKPQFVVKNERLVPVLEGGKPVTYVERSKMDDELCDRMKVLDTHSDRIQALFMVPRLNEPFSVYGLPRNATWDQVIAADTIKRVWIQEQDWYWDNEIGDFHTAGKWASQECIEAWVMALHLELERKLLGNAYQQLKKHFGVETERESFLAEVDGRNVSPKRWYKFWR